MEYLDFKPREKLGAAEKADFLTALMHQAETRTYGELEGRVSVLGGRLFRSENFFPANVPTGIYTLEAFLVWDGEMVSAHKTSLYVSKSGIEAEVLNLVHRYPEIYGVTAIMVAIAAGLAAYAGALRR